MAHEHKIKKVKNETAESNKEVVKVKAYYCKCGHLMTVIPTSDRREKTS